MTGYCYATGKTWPECGCKWHCPKCDSIKPPKAYHCPDCRVHFDTNYRIIDEHSRPDYNMSTDDAPEYRK